MKTWSHHLALKEILGLNPHLNLKAQRNVNKALAQFLKSVPNQISLFGLHLLKVKERKAQWSTVGAIEKLEVSKISRPVDTLRHEKNHPIHRNDIKIDDIRLLKRFLDLQVLLRVISLVQLNHWTRVAHLLVQENIRNVHLHLEWLSQRSVKTIVHLLHANLRDQIIML